MTASPDQGYVSLEAIPARLASGRAKRVRQSRLIVPPSFVVVVLYFLIGIAAYWPVAPHITHRLFSIDGDLALTMWFMGWSHHALAHGLNPFFSNAIFVPNGVNLAQNTAAPLLGLVTAPLSLVFSPLVIVNILMVVSMPISATAAFLVLRKWYVWGPAAAVGGLIYGFSPYMVGQGVGHPVLMFLPIPPFIAFTVVAILQGRGSPFRLGVQLGLLVAAQYLISQEVLATVAIFTVVATICAAFRCRALVRKAARAAAKPLAIGVAAAGAVLVYPIWMLIAGPQHAVGTPFPLENPYHNDLLSFIVPGPMQRISAGLGSVSSHIVGQSNPTEAGGYIGIPCLILAMALAWRSRRAARTQYAVLLLLVAAVLSLGPFLFVDGTRTAVPLPFWLLTHVPLLNNLLPSRLSFEMDACIAAIIAFGLDDLRRNVGRKPQRALRPVRIGHLRKGVIGAGVSLAVLIPTQLPLWPYDTKPAAALPTCVVRAIPVGEPTALTYPYDTYFKTESMVWQVRSGFTFRLIGGYAYHPDPTGQGSLIANFMQPNQLQQFLAGQEGVNIFGPRLPVDSTLLGATRAVLPKYDVRLVIVDRGASGSGPVVTLFNQVIGPPAVSSGHFVMWAKGDHRDQSCQ